MSKVEKLSIALTHRQAQALRDAVEEGGFATTSEAIRQAVEEWAERRERRHAESIKRIRALWDEGLASGVAEHRRTAEEIAADGRRRLAAMKQAG